jgi:hypothetical protein
MSTGTIIAVCVAVLALAPPAARADVVTDWNERVVAVTAAQNPFAQARFAAIAHLAMFEAANAVAGEYEPHLGTIVAPAGASAEAAVVAAAYQVLTHYFPASSVQLAAARTASLSAIADGPAKEAGMATGEAAAAAFIAARASDGAAPPQFFMPSSTEAGAWQLTPGCPPAGGVLYHWQNVTPFAVRSSRQFRAAPPPPLKSGRYRADLVEVHRVGAAGSLARPVDRADVAVFYNTALAVHVWNQAARHLASLHPASLVETARAFALLNMAISDALVTVMETKYHYTFWRPITAIADFTPYIATPCFPSYPSAHASASYAGAAVARLVWGDDAHSLVLTHPSQPQLVFHYTSLRQITADIDDARVYGGIHFRFDQEAGAKQGTRIGRYVVRHSLRPVR